MTGLTVEATFLLGVVGAAAPEILRLYELRTKPDDFKWTWNYLILTIPFLLLGGLAAVILPATTVWGAFYAGLSLPVTITAALKRVMGDQPMMPIGVPAGEIGAPNPVPGPIEGRINSSDRPTETASRDKKKPLDGFRAYIHALL